MTFGSVTSTVASRRSSCGRHLDLVPIAPRLSDLRKALDFNPARGELKECLSELHVDGGRLEALWRHL
jgi:hypothetical protein